MLTPSSPHYEHRFTLFGHTQAVTSLKFSTDGHFLASTCSSQLEVFLCLTDTVSASDNTIIIWNVLTGVHLKTLQGHTEGVNDVAWSNDSEYVASASDDYSVRIWNAQRVGKPVMHRYEPHFTFSLKGTQVKTLNGHNNPVFCVNYNPQSNLLASGSFDETVKIWDVVRGAACFPSHQVFFFHHSRLDTGTILRSISAHSDPVTSVSFSYDGTIIVTSSFDGLACVSILSSPNQATTNAAN